ncbi:hypothetical protein AB4259_11875 [Vibrio amylolyticus]|uniref:hypothetical protein n=1 Tax=Vibrio amylolyticus TaxID=2847292 RepID=UPI0035522C9C
MFAHSIRESIQDEVPTAQLESVKSALSPVVSGAIETLEQGRHFLCEITDEQYCYDATPHLTSTIGQHFRHWLDLFHALFQPEFSSESSHQPPFANAADAHYEIDYNQRRRGHDVEHHRQTAIDEISHFIDQLSRLSEESLTKSVMILTEVSLQQSEVCALPSTLGREITFSALHANHHYAMAKVVMSLLDVKTSDDFGLAPATATFIRGQ